jgi:chromosome segregation ATPase
MDVMVCRLKALGQQELDNLDLKLKEYMSTNDGSILNKSLNDIEILIKLKQNEIRTLEHNYNLTSKKHSDNEKTYSSLEIKYNELEIKKRSLEEQIECLKNECKTFEEKNDLLNKSINNIEVIKNEIINKKTELQIKHTKLSDSYKELLLITT